MSGKSRMAGLIVVGAVVVFGGLWVYLQERGKPAGTPRQGAPAQEAVGKVGKGGAGASGLAGQGPDAATGTLARVAGGGLFVGEPTAEDVAEAEAKRVIAPLQGDLDSDDLSVVAATARKIMDHPNAKVRLQAVESLAWAEADGFPDLSRMLLDADQQVARAALEAWALQVQSFESDETKAALLAKVGPVAMGMGADAVQDVMDAMFDMPDGIALRLLQGYAAQTNDPELIEKIIDAVNFRAMPEEAIENKGDIAKVIEEFLKREAEEAAEQQREAAETEPEA